MHPSVPVVPDEPPSRAALRRARRVLVKAGTSIVANEDGRPSLVRLSAIVEQVAQLCDSGVEVIFVSSGAVGMGKRVLRHQANLLTSFRDLRGGNNNNSKNSPAEQDIMKRTRSFVSLLDVKERPHTLAEKKGFYDSACASAGQFEMMNLYSSLFNQRDIIASQLLVTQTDFLDPQRLRNLEYAMERLLSRCCPDY